jgi:hypothetical protein
MFVVAVSIVGVGIDLGMASVDLQVLPLLRVLRVVRMFKLIPKAEGLRLLLRTLVLSLPGVRTCMAARKASWVHSSHAYACVATSPS